MKFSPCISGLCTFDGTHCKGCGRAHEEIAETKKMIKMLVDYAQMKEYENSEDFVNFVAKSVIKKLQNPS